MNITILPYIDQEILAKNQAAKAIEKTEEANSFAAALDSAQANQTTADSIASTDTNESVTTDTSTSEVTSTESNLTESNLDTSNTSVSSSDAKALTNKAVTDSLISSMNKLINSLISDNQNTTGDTSSTSNDTAVESLKLLSISAALLASRLQDNTKTVDQTDSSDSTNTVYSTGANGKSASDYEGDLKCSDELNSYFNEASSKYNVDVKLLKAIAKQESSFKADAVSKSGAVGIMQLMPKTAESLGVSDSYNARENILGGAKYISSLLEKYDGNVSYALAAYNAGSNNVDKYGGIPPFEETQNYVEKVTGYFTS